MKKATRAAAAVGSALVLALAGCGGDDDGGGGGGGSGESAPADFKSAYEDISSEIGAIGPDIADAVRSAVSGTNEQVEQAFDRLADRAQEVRDKVSDLEPPADVQAEVDALKDAISKGAQDLRDITSAATDGDAAQAADAARALVADSPAITEAREKLDAAVAQLK